MRKFDKYNSRGSGTKVGLELWDTIEIQIGVLSGMGCNLAEALCRVER